LERGQLVRELLEFKLCLVSVAQAKAVSIQLNHGWTRMDTDEDKAKSLLQ
jgi:hypothetical protein